MLEINNTFDACNSKNLYDLNCNKRPMTENNKYIFEQLNKTITTFQNSKKIAHTNKKKINTTTFHRYDLFINGINKIISI